MYYKPLLTTLIAGLFITPLIAPLAQASVSADEAAKLRTTLTPLGAEKAANKDGSIPSWEGGLTRPRQATKMATRARTCFLLKNQCCPSTPRTWRSLMPS